MNVDGVVSWVFGGMSEKWTDGVTLYSYAGSLVAECLGVRALMHLVSAEVNTSLLRSRMSNVTASAA
jgi:hypothetical protein